MPELRILSQVDALECPPVDAEYDYRGKTYRFRICNPCSAASHWQIEGDEMSEAVSSAAIRDTMAELMSTYNRTISRLRRVIKYGDSGEDEATSG